MNFLQLFYLKLHIQIIGKKAEVKTYEKPSPIILMRSISTKHLH